MEVKRTVSKHVGISTNLVLCSCNLQPTFPALFSKPGVHLPTTKMFGYSVSQYEFVLKVQIRTPYAGDCGMASYSKPIKVILWYCLIANGLADLQHIMLASQALSQSHLFYADFCSGSVWELSRGAKSLLTASTESAGNPFNYSLASKYEFVLWGDGISMFLKHRATHLRVLIYPAI